MHIKPPSPVKVDYRSKVMDKYEKNPSKSKDSSHEMEKKAKRKPVPDSKARARAHAKKQQRLDAQRKTRKVNQEARAEKKAARLHRAMEKKRDRINKQK